MHEYQSFRDTLQSCDNNNKWLSLVTRIAERYGFRFVTLMHMPKPKDQYFAPLVICSNLPANVARTIDQHQLLHSCHTLARLEFTLLPIAWDTSECQESAADEMMLSSIMRENGIERGMLFTFTSLSNERFIIRFDGNEQLLEQHDINNLSMYALIAFDKFQTMRRIALTATKTLTRREIEVVRWTAQGKTSSEIAAILTLSDHTVNAYMNNAIKKLECVNRTQLVAKAIRLKLIA